MPTKKKNPFCIYMLQRKNEIEKKLKRKVAMSELPDLLYLEWQALPEGEKQKYKFLAKDSNYCVEKCDCRGIPISLIQDKEEAERIKLQEMRKDIKTTVDMLKTGKSLTSANFVVICITHYIHMDNDTYIPAEIGVCQFSFAKGISSSYHRILPACIPPGYRHEAMLHSEQTHNLLLNVTKESDGFQNELYMYLLKDGSRLPNVYTQNDFMESVESILDKFQLKSSVKVYSLDYLFQQLYSASQIDVPESVASSLLSSSEFEWSPGVSCSWHEQMAPDAGKYCSLSYSRRWIFNMCNAMRLQEKFGIQLIKGKHIPESLPLMLPCNDFMSSGMPYSDLREIAPTLVQTLRPVTASKDDELEVERNRNGLNPVDQKPRGVFLSPSGIESSSISANIGKKKEIGGVQIGCLGLVGFGRGKKKTTSS